MLLERAVPWPMPEKNFCHFYHSMSFPNGDDVTGHWDIRGRFDQYIGRYPLRGKTMLDVGTAAGFVAFEAEKAGAVVTGTDLKHVSEITLLPFKEHPYQSGDIRKWEEGVEADWRHIKSAFWYAWHSNSSGITMSYTPLRDLKYIDERFDVVIGGAILEHLSDPVSAIGTFARLAKEAVIIAFTPVLPTEELLMRPINAPLDNPNNYFTWWALSRGLYRRIFSNLGFSIEIVPASAFNVDAKTEVTRKTIIARRAENMSAATSVGWRCHLSRVGRKLVSRVTIRRIHKPSVEIDQRSD